MTKQKISVIRSVVLTEDLVYYQIKKNGNDLTRLFEKIADAGMNITFITSDVHRLVTKLPLDKVNLHKITLIKDNDVASGKKRDFKKVLKEVLETNGIDAFHTMLMSISETDFKITDRLGVHFVLIGNKKTGECSNIQNITQVSLGEKG